MSGSPDKAVLVTGTSSSIGRAFALLLAKNRLRVFASVRKDASENRSRMGRR